MAQQILSFKAGKCDGDFDASPPKIKSDATPGYVYLYAEDDFVHFCWRSRAASLNDAELDLMMIPGDATFLPYVGPNKPTTGPGPVKSPVNGRIFVLKFTSSSQRYLFWLQAKPRGDPSQFSTRELELGEKVNIILQAEDVDYAAALGTPEDDQPGDEDDDTMMEDVNPTEQQSGGRNTGGTTSSGGAQGGASSNTAPGGGGGGGGGGGRANLSNDQATAAIQNLLKSINAGSTSAGSLQQDKPFTTLAELLQSSTTVPAIEKANSSFKEDLLVRHLPSTLLFLEHQVDDFSDAQADEDIMRASAQALDQDQQNSILRRVLRSPQLAQGLVSLTAALRDGGLPSVSDALGIKVENGGFTQRGSGVPLSGGAAVEAFLEGIKKSVEEEMKSK